MEKKSLYTTKSQTVSETSQTIDTATKAPKRPRAKAIQSNKIMKRLKPEYAHKMSVLFTIPNEDFEEWPTRLIVVKDMNNMDIPGQSASFRTAVRQGILTRLLMQPSIITLNKDASTFAQYFPTEGFEHFIKAVRKMFRSITEEPLTGFPTVHSSTNSPYAGYLLEFATAEERANFDLNLVRDNAGTTNRIFPHGKPMFASDLKKYVEDRKDELDKFMKRLFESNTVYSQVEKWTPEPAPTKGRLKRIPYRPRPSYPGSKARVVSNAASSSSLPLALSIAKPPSKLQLNWSDDTTAIINKFSIQDVKDYIYALVVEESVKQKMLTIEMNGEVFTSVTNMAEFMATYKMTLIEAFNVIKAMNSTTLVEASDDDESEDENAK